MDRLKGKSLLTFPDDCCVVDLETTDFDPAYGEIIEIGAIRVRGGVQVDQFSALVQPDEPVDDFATKLTGITNDMLTDAQKIGAVLPVFRDFLATDIIVGHNVSFDINFLYDNSIGCGLHPVSNDFVDTMRLARIILPELEHHRLKDLRKHYQISDADAHRALGDCNATLAILSQLRATAAEKGIDLQAHQAKQKLRAGDLSAQTDQFDESHPLYGKVCVFTGTLTRMQRRDAMQLVLDLGGTCGDSVTKKTNYLIIGDGEYAASVKDGKTGKMKKAEDLILKGNDLTMLSESAFFDMI